MVFALIMFVILAVFMIPLFYYIYSIHSSTLQSKLSYEPVSQLSKEQVNLVYTGNPNIYYNSTENSPSLVFNYNSVPQPINITYVYYFNGSMWVIGARSITIDGDQVVDLPSKAFNKPIVLITSLGNIFYLNPNTSVTSSLSVGVSGEVEVAFVALATNGTNVYPVSVQFGVGGRTYTTPQVLSITPGTYSIYLENQSVFLQRIGLTGTFANWSTLGYVKINNPYVLTTQMNVFGTGIVTIVYNLQTKKYQVNLQIGNLPLNVKLSEYNSKIQAVNNNITISIDGKPMTVSYSGTSYTLPLTLTYGYHYITLPTPANITFNYIYSSKTVQNGQITTYNIKSYSTNEKSLIRLNITTFEIFVNNSGSVIFSYSPVNYYFLVTFKNNFVLPPGQVLTYNTTPILGDIAGQFLQLLVNGANQVYGPLSNYQPESIYMQSGTYKITNIYSSCIVGNFTINGNSYKELISNANNVSVYPTNSSSYTANNGGNITINSPTTVITYETWKYGLFPIVSVLVFDKRKKRKVGLSNTITFLILIMIALIVLLPILLELNLNMELGKEQLAVVNDYVYLKNLEEKAVTTGHPSIFYDGKSNLIVFIYTNGTFVPKIPLIITSILYFNNGLWQNLTSINYPIVVNNPSSLKLPSIVSGKPVIIVTKYGNIFFIQPNASIGPTPVAVAEGGFVILSQIAGYGNVYTTVVTLTVNNKQYKTPVTFPNTSGVFIIAAPKYAYKVNSNGSVVTGEFHNWIVIGSATLNTTTSNVTKVTVTGSATLIANYSIITKKVVFTINTNSPDPVIISVNGNKYNVSQSSPLQINVVAGYVNLTVLQPIYNDTSQMSNGIIQTYGFQYWSYNGNNYPYDTVLIFIPPSQSSATVNLSYEHLYNYYRVTLKVIYSYPPGVSIYNINYNNETPNQIISNQNWPFIIINGTTYYALIQYNSSTGSDYGSTTIWIKQGVYIITPKGIYNSSGGWYVNGKGPYSVVATQFQQYQLQGGVIALTSTTKVPLTVNIAGPGTIEEVLWWNLVGNQL